MDQPEVRAAGGLSVVFGAGGRLCALPVERVAEIMRPLPVEALAGVPAFVRGLCIIRGRPVAVVSAASLVGGGDVPATRVVMLRGHPLALAVDAVLGLRAIVEASLGECPPLLADAAPEVVAALAVSDRDALLLLGDMRLVSQRVWSAIESRLAA